jgi:hypothetical protein
VVPRRELQLLERDSVDRRRHRASSSDVADATTAPQPSTAAADYGATMGAATVTTRVSTPFASARAGDGWAVILLSAIVAVVWLGVLPLELALHAGR